MIYHDLSNSDINKKYEHLLGKSLGVQEQLKSGFTGSSLYRLQGAAIDGKSLDLDFISNRANFEKLSKGFVLRINVNQKLSFIVIPLKSVEKIELIKGEEKCIPGIFSIMGILLKLGVKLRYARYFSLSLNEYSIDRMKLRIKTSNGQIELDSNGYNYEAEKSYFDSRFIKYNRKT